jgi:hypothetical protein
MFICWRYGRKYKRIENAYTFLVKVITGSLFVIITIYTIKLFNFSLVLEIILITILSILSYFLFGILVKNEIIVSIKKNDIYQIKFVNQENV